MWDLDTIIRQNNQAAIDGMMRGKIVEEVQQPMPEVWPLTALASKLMAGPPLISEVCSLLGNIDSEKAFLELIRVLFPEHEERIMREPRNLRVYKFGYLFAEKYYPLPLNTSCDTRDLIHGMPVELMGMSYSAYHDLDVRRGYLLLLSLVIYPYEGDWRDEEDDMVPFDPVQIKPAGKFKPSATDINWVRDMVNTLAVNGVWVAPMGFSIVEVSENKILLTRAKDTPEVRETIRRTLICAERAGIDAAFSSSGRTSEEKVNGAKIPILNMVKEIVGGEISKSIFQAGWVPGELHRITDDTRYSGVADFADWVCSSTGCVLLDSSYDKVEYIEGWSEPVFQWTRRNVLTLTEQWPKVQQIRGNIDKLVEWLEADLINNFRELLEFILKGNPKNVVDIHRDSYDALDYICELDIEVEGEDENDDD